MALTTAIAIVVSFYLYRWRRILIADKRITVPEELAKALYNLGKGAVYLRTSIELMDKRQKTTLEEFSIMLSTSNNNISNVESSTLTMHRALDQRDAEINRLKQGYDAEILRKFLWRFVRIRQAVEDLRREDEAASQSLHQIDRLLVDALEECGVEQFVPAVGADYRTAHGVADNPRTLKAKNSQDAFKIADVVEPGYRFRGDLSNPAIVPARVSIFVD